MAGAGALTSKPVGIFWDIENCAVPKGKGAAAVIGHIRGHFVTNRLNHREFEFLIACDITKLKKEIPDDINRAGGVTLAHVSGASKNAADEKLRDAMKKFVDTHVNNAVPTLVLISGDIDYVNDLRGYQVRQGCAVILLHAPKTSEQFKIGWNELYAFEQFCQAVPFLASKGPPAGGAAAAPFHVPPPLTPLGQGFQKGPPPQKKDFTPNKGLQDHKGANGSQKGGKGPQPPQQGFKGPPGPQNQQKGAPGAPGGGPKKQFPGKGPQPPGGAPGFQKQRQDSDGSSNSGNGGGPQGKKNKEKPQTPNQGPNMGKLTAGVGNLNIAPSAAAPGGDPKGPKLPNFILVVMGLPGKMDYVILKEALQVHANTVGGKVKYVKNGQAYIGFKTKEQADKAVALFNGKEVFDKKLNVSFCKKIPFENLLDKKLKGAAPPEGFVMVDKADVAALPPNKGAAKSSGGGGPPKNGPGTSKDDGGAFQGFLNDPSFVGTIAGAMIREIGARRGAGAGGSGGAPAGKGQDTCPIQ